MRVGHLYLTMTWHGVPKCSLPGSHDTGYNTIFVDALHEFIVSDTLNSNEKVQYDTWRTRGHFGSGSALSI